MISRTFFFVLFIIVTISFQSCEKDENENNNAELKDFVLNPQNPTSNDNILIIDEICGYEEFISVQITDNNIVYSRQFNSSMGRPCVLETDTAIIGKLAAGDYTLIYNLIDISHLVNDTLAESDTIYFTVDE